MTVRRNESRDAIHEARSRNSVACGFGADVRAGAGFVIGNSFEAVSAGKKCSQFVVHARLVLRQSPGNSFFDKLLGVLAIGNGDLLQACFNVGREMDLHDFQTTK